MPKPINSPGRNKRRQSALQYLHKNDKKPKTVNEPLAILELPLNLSPQSSLLQSQSENLSLELQQPTLLQPPSLLPLQETSPQIPPILSSIANNSEIYKSVHTSTHLKKIERSTNTYLKTENKYTNTEEFDSILFEQALLIRKQSEQIKSYRNRINEVEQQRNKWRKKALQKVSKKVNTVAIKPLSALDDMLFCVKFDLSTRKRKEMKAFLRKKHIHFFAKNEEVRKIDFVQQIESSFEYSEDKEVDKNDKETIISSLTCTEPEKLITHRLEQYAKKGKLPLVNGKIRMAKSGDKGRGWTKACVEIIDIPCSASRDNVLVLAIFNAKDDYTHVEKYCKKLFLKLKNLIFITINGQIYEIEWFGIGDMPWLCGGGGHAGHSAICPCLLCYTRKNKLFELSTLRTLEGMINDSETQVNSQKFRPIIYTEPSNIVPSCLHIPLGIGSDALKILESLEISIGKRNSIKSILTSFNLSRHPKTRQLNGNDMRKLLTQPKIIQAIRAIFIDTIKEEEADKIIDVCSLLGVIQCFMSIKHFNDNEIVQLENLISRFEKLYIESSLNYTPKGHWLIHHVPLFVRKHKFWGSATEQGQEAVHGIIDDDFYRYRSLPVKKRLQLTVIVFYAILFLTLITIDLFVF